jgi:hypothetical protein
MTVRCPGMSSVSLSVRVGPFPLLRWRRVELRMASSQVDEQSVWSPERRCASGLLAANMLAVV